MEQTFHVYKLYFQTSLHLSRGKQGSYESSDHALHSDTLKSALYACMRQLFADETLSKNFMDKVTLSSAFPFQDHEKETIFWLPRPLIYRSKYENADNRKKFKGINYVTVAQMSLILRGEHPSDLLKDGKAYQPKIWEQDTTQRVKINYGDDSEPFYLEKLYPQNKDSSGLYFIVSGDVNTQSLEAALRLLGDNGIGLQRNLGNGQFKYKKDSFTMSLPEKNTAWVALSLFRPNKEDLTKDCLDNSFYQFTKRGGWISSAEDEAFLSIRKKSIMMFTEGSIFAFGEKTLRGKVENIRPDWDTPLHEIFRDGKAIFLPITI